MEPAKRDFSSISPSAKALLLMKSFTEIPFAREAAKLFWTKEELAEKSAELPSKAFFVRLVHFENRYWTVSTILEKTGIRNILEISSGFSFRGLDKTLHEDVFYIDTDLEDVISTKKELLYQLVADNGKDLVGNLLTEPLNVLDKHQFQSLIERFPPGPVCIVNEGLLMYLNLAEKLELGKIIHDILADRGGCWITADVYIKNKDENKVADDSHYAQQAAKFLAAHNVEENKFDSYAAAKQYFLDCGFKVAASTVLAFDKLSSLKYTRGNNISIDEETVLKWSANRQTWKLEIN